MSHLAFLARLVSGLAPAAEALRQQRTAPRHALTGPAWLPSAEAGLEQGQLPLGERVLMVPYCKKTPGTTCIHMMAPSCASAIPWWLSKLTSMCVGGRSARLRCDGASARESLRRAERCGGGCLADG